MRLMLLPAALFAAAMLPSPLEGAVDDAATLAMARYACHADAAYAAIAADASATCFRHYDDAYFTTPALPARYARCVVAAIMIMIRDGATHAADYATRACCR